MRTWLAVCVGVWMMTSGCGRGTSVNGRMAPEITSTPPGTATVGVPFNYTVNAGGMTPIAFAVVSGPEEFALHPTSGVVTWTPQSEGLVAIEIRATNLAGSDTQAFEVDVQDLNAPVFITEPPTDPGLERTGLHHGAPDRSDRRRRVRV
ncbi:MAG: hypothetical protein JRE19_10650 [Deltaproteobacteria bacterium]|nr:hypothetical protein [Deltaproteobacteria bacterium]